MTKKGTRKQPAMKHRTLGSSGLEVSEVGFGAWQIGAEWGDEVPAADARAALAAAVEAGVNFFDTADIYGAGRSERIIGEFLADRNADVHVATKMGKAAGWDDGYDQMARAAETSCQRLGVECLDLVQLHCVPLAMLQAGQVFQNLEKLQQCGLIRHYGASVETIEEGCSAFKFRCRLAASDF